MTRGRAEVPLASLQDGEERELWLELQPPQQDTEVALTPPPPCACMLPLNTFMHGLHMQQICI